MDATRTIQVAVARLDLWICAAAPWLLRGVVAAGLAWAAARIRKRSQRKQRRM